MWVYVYMASALFSLRYKPNKKFLFGPYIQWHSQIEPLYSNLLG